MAHLIRRLLFIVRADRPELYESLRRTFHGDDTVEVVRDRRSAERRGARRTAAASAAREHRTPERRKSPELDRQLRSRGYAVVGVTAPGPPFPISEAPGGTTLQ
jgi:hypothetical protein